MGPILTKLGMNHPWREENHIRSKEGDCPLQVDLIAKE
jgi:hypothetical protein